MLSQASMMPARRDHRSSLQLSLFCRAFAKELQGATEAHLFDLYSELVAPIRARLRGRHLVFVPHDVLHCLPFHALWDGERFLIEDFTVSYAPSASVYRLCCIKPPVTHQTSLVMGVPARVTRHVDDGLRARIRGTWEHYVAEAARHRSGAFPIERATL